MCGIICNRPICNTDVFVACQAKQTVAIFPPSSPQTLPRASCDAVRAHLDAPEVFTVCPPAHVVSRDSVRGLARGTVALARQRAEHPPNRAPKDLRPFRSC